MARERAWLARGELTGQALPPARAGGRALTELVIDVDAALLEVHSDKEGASSNFKGGFGYQCAMRRSVVSRCSREELGRRFLGLMTYLDPKW